MKKAIVVSVLLLAGASEASAVCYVSPTGAGDGSSWSSAMSDLESALGFCSEIHVAAGLYTPQPPFWKFHLNGSFNVRAGTKLIGGYTGAGSDPDARDPSTNLTVLSGDYENDDANSSSSHIGWSAGDIRGTNARHVLVLNGEEGPITENTLIDGFVITGGDAAMWDSSDPHGDSGGGLLCLAERAGAKCSPKLINNQFVGNRAERTGGAIANLGWDGESSPQIAGCRFYGNNADYGGAIYNEGINGIASPRITNSTIDSNFAASFGGAIYNNGSDGEAFPFIQDTTFAYNTANDRRGAVMFSDGTESGIAGAYLLNVTSSANNNNGISAFENYGADGFSEIFASNSILWDSESGMEVVDHSAASEFDHSVVRNGCPATASWCSNVFVDDPELGEFQNNGGNLPTFMPAALSVVVDNGTDNPIVCPATDERSVARPQGNHCDIGAVERRVTD